MVKIEMGDVEALAKKLSKVSNSYPNEVNKFMEKSVNGMKNSIASKEDPRWKQKIGHSPYVENTWEPFSKARYALSSIKDGIKSWWIINNKMFYERFVNDGHAIRRKKRGPEIGYAKPTHHIEKGVKDYEPTFFNECDKFVDNLLGV